MNIRNALLAALLTGTTFMFGINSIHAQSATPSGEIRAITQDIADFAALTGAKITDVKFEIAPQAGEVSTTNTSCTVSATVSIPGGTGATVSATAPTCMEAWKMIRQMISEMTQ